MAVRGPSASEREAENQARHARKPPRPPTTQSGRPLTQADPARYEPDADATRTGERSPPSGREPPDNERPF
jgi:hypothetical protein